MTRDQIINVISEQLAQVLDEDEVSVTEETTADDVEGWDSIAHVKLIIALESALGVRFETDEITAPDNIGQLADIIARKLPA